MSAAGRPLRFLIATVGGWITMRVVMLWPTIDSFGDLARAIVPVAQAEVAIETTRPIDRPHNEMAGARPALSARGAVASLRWNGPAGPLAERMDPASGRSIAFSEAQRDTPPIIAGLPQGSAAAAPGHRPRLSGSAWLVARGNGGIGPGVVGGQLGGSQAGVRIAYAIDRRHRLALAGRVTTSLGSGPLGSGPLGSGLREAAIGLEWQPTRLPIRIVAEQRFAIDGGSGGPAIGPAIGLVGGAGPVLLGGGFRIEGYGQAGIIKRVQAEAYIDGAVRVFRPIGTLGAVRLDFGAGTWGAAQRGAARLDVGPSASATVPLAGQAVRLTLDWRQRLAGGARPGSGLALTLGTDF